MGELLWAAAIAIGLGALTVTQLVPWYSLVETGQATMLTSAAVALPIEAVYYALLYGALGSARPEGWYWRPFAHHHLLLPSQRWWVLPFFYAGALGFVAITLGIAIVLLGFVAVVRQ